MRRHWVWLVPFVLVCLIGAALFLWQPWRALPPSAPPNILLVTIDALRSDHVDAYGAARGLTPHLDQLATEAVLFEETVTPAPLSAAGLASIVTGRLPIQHRLRTDLRGTLPNSETTAAEWLRESGYRTAAFLGARFPFACHLTQGCDSVSVPRGPERPAHETVDALAAWFKDSNATAQPRFAWIHLPNPRGPWRAAFPWCLEYLEQPYSGEVAAVDDAVGRLIVALGEQDLLANTHLVIVGTSGEALDEQGEIEHGVLLDAVTVRVPWLWRLPGARPGSGLRVGGLAATTDLLPTLIDWVDPQKEAPAPEFEGQSLRASMEHGTETTRKQVMLETFHPQQHYGWAPLVGLWSEGWLYVASPEPRVHNLRTAPQEPQPMMAEIESIAAQLHQVLAEEIAKHSPNQEDAESWESWGQGRPDPYDRVSLSSDLIEACRDLQSGDPGSAQRNADRLVARFPDNPRVQALRAFTHLSKGEWLASERGFQQILGRFGRACEARLGLAESMLAQNNASEALAALGNQTPDSLGNCLWLLAPDPDLDFRHWRVRGLAEARMGNLSAAGVCFHHAQDVAQLDSQRHHMGRLAEAVRVLSSARQRIGQIHPRERLIVAQAALQLQLTDLGREILGLDDLGNEGRQGSHPDPLAALLSAYDLAGRGKMKPAVDLLHQALAQEMASAENVVHIAGVLEQRGRHEEAIALLEQAIPQFPQSAELYFNLALFRAQDRSPGKATVSLQAAFRRGFREWDRLLNRSLRRICRQEEMRQYWQEPQS